jgi:hypothetical protein
MFNQLFEQGAAARDICDSGDWSASLAAVRGAALRVI